MPVAGGGKLLDCRMLAAAAIAIACALAGPSYAAAEQFVVNTTADEPDAAVGNEFCETAIGKCTMRAAIEEANATAEGFDEIRFEEEAFEGDADSVIHPTTALPAIESPLALSGRECQTEAGFPGPCAEIAGEPDDPGLKVKGAEEVLIELVAVTGSEVGIELLGADEFWVRSNWLGTSLDGSAAGNGTGIKVGPGSVASRVGGEGPGSGNLIANSSAAGLEILGASHIRVIGNTFGVKQSGTEAAANAVDIEVGSTATSVALENTIGTRVSPEAAATPICDGGCNLVSGAAGSGIDLDGGSVPPVGTTIAGNLIGYDSAGTGSIPNGGAGISVGGAPLTEIGGPKSGDANRFSGGTAAVEAGPAPALAVRGNLIGSQAGPAVPPSIGGILVDSTGLLLPAEEGSIADNRIGLDGGTGISQVGFGATISGNLVEGADTGIHLFEAAESLVERNRVAGATGAGILIEANSTELRGNEIAGAGTGIRLHGEEPFGISANVIGGDNPADENTIEGSDGAAIEIADTEKSVNEVARNHGSGNGGPFIDLVPSASGSGDPNNGVQPPPITSISENGAAGFAEPEATVRMFRKASPLSGEIESFLGTATADEKGSWSIAFPAPLPAGTGIAATQTWKGGTSELSISAVPVGEGRQDASAGAGAPADRKAPRTRMLKQPKRVRSGRPARFAFTSNERGSSFQCSLDRAAFKPCRSPKKYRLSRPGKHLFRVRAVDPAGNVDPTPVRRRFEVLG